MSNRDTKKICKNIVGPLDHYCVGASMAPLDSYLVTPIISYGSTVTELTHPGSGLLDEIVAFDSAEGNYANVTQTNMITVSSFVGLNGLVFGYDLAKQKIQRNPLIGNKYKNVYDLEPLMAAAKSLYGTVKEKHFPIMPGQHLMCAYKEKRIQGPSTLYGVLALAIAEDRAKNADLFMEDIGTILLGSGREIDGETSKVILENIIHSVYKIAVNLKVHYKEIFVSLKVNRVKVGETGCMLTAAPYIKLAKKAVPGGESPSVLLNMSFKQWEQKTSRDYFDKS